MTKKTIYLIRHGQHHSDNKTDSKLGGNLTSIGIQQAKLTAKRLHSIPIHKICFSPLHRATETAKMISQEFPEAKFEKTSYLCECIPPYISSNFTKNLNVSSSEDFMKAKQKAERAFEKYFKRTRSKNRQEIIVSHGNLIRYLICRVLQAPGELWIHMQIHNCSISEIQIESNGRMRLISYNDTGHFPDELKTV